MSNGLADLSVGDKVSIGSVNLPRDKEIVYRIEVIERLTSTQIICGSSRYRRSNGNAIGSTVGRVLRRATPQDFQFIEERDRKRKERNVLNNADREKRQALEMLFARDLHPSISSGSSAKPETYDLTFCELTEEQIKRLAGLLR